MAEGRTEDDIKTQMEKNIFRRYEHAPVKFTLCVETLYRLCEKMDKDLGTTSMPNLRLRKEILVDDFPKDLSLA